MRNIWRTASRSSTTALTLAVGIVALITLECLILGADAGLLRFFLTTACPEATIHHEGFRGFEPDQAGWPLSPLLSSSDTVVAAVSKCPAVAVVTPVVYFDGQLSDGMDLLPCKGVGVEPLSYVGVYPAASMVGGRFLVPEDDDAVVLGSKLAAEFGLTVGASITILAQTRYGALSARQLRVVGLRRTGNVNEDGRTVYLALTTVRSLLELELDTSSAVLVRAASLDLPIGSIETALQHGGYSCAAVTGWYERSLWIRQLKTRRTLGLAVVGCFIAITVVAGFVNALLISAHERRREIGTLQALGFTRVQVVGVFVAEGTILGTGAAVVGAVTGGLVTWLLSVYGLDLSIDGERTLLFGPSRLYASFSVPVLVKFGVSGILAAFVSSLYPAWLVSRNDPAVTVRGAT